MQRSYASHSLKYKIKFMVYFFMTMFSFLGLILTILAQFTGILVKSTDMTDGIFRAFGVY